MNFLWLKDAKKGLQLWALRAFVLLVIVAGAGFIGYVFGRSYGPAQPAVSAQAPVCVPASANTREAMAKRNVVWRVWNGQGASLPPTPERALAAALGMILSPEADVGNRNTGMSMYLQKSVAYFTPQDIREIQALMNAGDPQKLAEALRRIATADGDAADLVRAVLADRERVERFVTGSGPIPLETMPDGSTP
ncbi:MAG TPA: hypothetical protein VLC10_01790 [Patescibacteria group bacterium]|nr:hypothetical protein [Patescibacteria group bacterium]